MVTYVQSFIYIDARHCASKKFKRATDISTNPVRVLTVEIVKVVLVRIKED